MIKVYFGVVVNSDVSFGIEFGEIYVLLGENGVGKLILVKMIYGFVKLDSGIMYLNGVVFIFIDLCVVWVVGIVMVF